MVPVGHTAEIYRTDEDLVASVAAFLRQGLDHGVPGVVLATAEHRRLIRDAVGCELIEADADETLALLVVDGLPSPDAFDEVIGALIDGAGGPVRAYGELVSLLCEEGNVAAAVALEGLWNELIAEKPVTLHCGYRLDVFDLATQTEALPHICRLHTRLEPAPDEARFADAVDRSLTAVLGAERTQDVYYIVGRGRRQRAPIAQEALRWLSSTMPSQAAEVLELARARYG